MSQQVPYCSLTHTNSHSREAQAHYSPKQKLAQANKYLYENTKITHSHPPTRMNWKVSVTRAQMCTEILPFPTRQLPLPCFFNAAIVLLCVCGQRFVSIVAHFDVFIFNSSQLGGRHTQYRVLSPLRHDLDNNTLLNQTQTYTTETSLLCLQIYYINMYLYKQIFCNVQNGSTI